MPRDSAQNAFKAGVFVVVSIALLVTIILVLANVRERLAPRTEYAVRFSLIDGAPGLTGGSEVQVGGRPVGRVTGVRLDFDNGRGEPESILVDVAVDDRLSVYPNAVAYLERPLLGSGAVLNFEDLGDPTAGAPLDPGGVIDGLPQVPAFLEQAGYGQTQRQQLRDILDRADGLTEKIDDAADDFIEVVGQFRERSGAWYDQTDRLMAGAADLPAQVSETVADAREFIATVREMADENREPLSRTVANAEATTADAREIAAHLNETTVALVDDFLKEGRAGAEEARAAIDRVDTLVAEQTPAVRKAMANARLASDQLRLTIGEIRRTPWRLLYRPSEKELEFELLYDAARAYATAVSDLRDASESLDALATAEQPLDPARQDAVAEYLRSIEDAFGRYRDAEQRFLTLISNNAP